MANVVGPKGEQTKIGEGGSTKGRRDLAHVIRLWPAIFITRRCYVVSEFGEHHLS